MCDHHNLQTQPVPGEGLVNHVHKLSENIGSLFTTQEYSDVTLIVEDVRFQAHKVVLAACSEYFRALFFGGLKESTLQDAEIELKDTNASAFKHLLKYIYTGCMNLVELKEDILFEVLGLAHRYGFVELEEAISFYLEGVLDNNNVCLIFDLASMFNLRSLCENCLRFMDRNAQEIIKTEAFQGLSVTALEEILRRDSFYAPEICIFRALQHWREKNPDVAQFSQVIKHIRLPLMTLDELLNIVRPSSLVTADSILDAIQVKNHSRDMQLSYRGVLRPDQNIATMRHGAQVIRGEMKASLLDGDCQNYDLDRGFTRHPIDENNGGGIVIKLALPSIINNIKMLLWDRDMRSYSYQVEVSMDDKDWVRIIDYSQYLCRSWQNLRFPATVVRYIRVVGTHNTVNRVFHLVTFEALYNSTPCTVENGIIVPDENVATVKNSAMVIEGVSRSRNALINGDTKNYDWDSGYTCHQLGSGSIIVQLSQPYLLSDLRILLWDCDGRSYSFYVEVSNNMQKWSVVADKTKEACKSWITMTFKKQPVTFFKIVGTHNTANDVFHCVHFECPANSKGEPEQEKGNSRSSPQGAAAAGPAHLHQNIGGMPQGLGPIPDDNGNPQDALDHR